MFETTTRDGVPLQVRVSFGQCVKAGVAFGIGYTIVAMLTNLGTLISALAAWGGILGALAHR